MHLSMYHDETYESLEDVSLSLTLCFSIRSFFSLILSVSLSMFLFSFCNSLSWSETRQMGKWLGSIVASVWGMLFFPPLSPSQTPILMPTSLPLFTVTFTHTHCRPAFFLHYKPWFISIIDAASLFKQRCLMQTNSPARLWNEGCVRRSLWILRAI